MTWNEQTQSCYFKLDRYGRTLVLQFKPGTGYRRATSNEQQPTNLEIVVLALPESKLRPDGLKTGHRPFYASLHNIQDCTRII